MKAFWADGDAGDGRDAVVIIPMMQNRCLPHRTPGFADRRDQEEPRFVYKDEMGCQPCGVFLPGARRIVSIRRWPGCHAPRPDVPASGGSRPAGAGACPRDCDGISLEDDVRSLRQFVGLSRVRSVSVRQGPFGQEMNQFLFLFWGQPGWPTRGRLGFQGILLAGPHRISPTKNTAGVATHTSADFVKGELLFQESHRTASAFFQGFWKTFSRMETPPTRISPLYCINYAEVNNISKPNFCGNLASMQPCNEC